ncbi:CYTH domain-containing protein, partial [Candidatus Saccharibacteria bacterium]|nr:CYTH domain-containing protein [Candidatus Saccharibacteria bacterium]
AEVVRNRQKLQVDDVTFYLDDVDELGTYVKLERELKKDEDIEKIRRELWEVLKVLGVDKSNAEPDTYTAQLLKK